MFIVLLTYVKPLEQVDTHIEAHKVFLDQYYTQGKFLASGPKVPRTGGVILVHCKSRQEGYRKYKPPFCSSSEVSYLKFPHSFTAQAPILTAGPA